MGRHGPSVVIRALELVVRVALLRCVAVMNGARDCQTLGDQFRRSFGDHLGRSLILEPAHAFVEVVVLRVVHEIVTDPAVGPAAHDQTSITVAGVEPSFAEGLPKGGDIGHKVVLPQGVECGLNVVLVVQPPAPQLIGPELLDYLSDVFALADADGIGVGWVLFLDVVFAVVQGLDVLAAFVEEVAT